MALHTTKMIGSAWTQLTDADVSTILTVQNASATRIMLAGTAAAVPVPADDAPSIVLGPYERIANMKPSDLFPGVTGTAKRVWARTQHVEAPVMVSHA